MTADPINLRRKRKEKARAERAAEAAQNRARFGRTGAEKAQARAETDMAARRLDGHKVEQPADNPDSAGKAGQG